MQYRQKVEKKAQTMQSGMQTQRRLRSSVAKATTQAKRNNVGRHEELVRAASRERGVRIKQEMIQENQEIRRGKEKEPITIEEEGEDTGKRSAGEEDAESTTGQGETEEDGQDGVEEGEQEDESVREEGQEGPRDEKKDKEGQRKRMKPVVINLESEMVREKERKVRKEGRTVDFMQEFEEEIDEEVEARYRKLQEDREKGNKGPLAVPLPRSPPKSRREEGEALGKEPQKGTRFTQGDKQGGVGRGEELRHKKRGGGRTDREDKGDGGDQDHTEGKGVKEKEAARRESIEEEKAQVEEEGDLNQIAEGRTKRGNKEREAKSGEDTTKAQGMTQKTREAMQSKQTNREQREGANNRRNNDKQAGGYKEREDEDDKEHHEVAKEAEAKEGGSNQGRKTMKQAVVTEPAVVWRQHAFRLQFSFMTTGPPNTAVSYASVQQVYLNKAIREFVQQAQAIDSTLAINTWRDEDKLPTIQKEEDVPATLKDIRKFIRPPPGARLKSGATNWYWSIRVTANSRMKDFIEVWEAERRKAPRDSKPLPIRSTPLQAEEWHEAGLFIGSTSDQEKEVLTKGLRDEMQDPNLGINWQSIVFPGCNKFWAIARDRAQEHGNAAKYASAPMALQVLVDSKDKVKQTLIALYGNYGKVEKDGSWPSLPDGSKMRFIPNFQFSKDAMSRNRITKRMQLQIQMHWRNRTFPIPIKDPRREVEIEGRKTTVGQLVLQEIYKEQVGEKEMHEPYFRHFVKRWTPAGNNQEYDIAVHEHMVRPAKRKLKTLAKDMIEKYGEIMEAHIIATDTEEVGGSISTGEIEESWELDDGKDDTNDMYMTGKATTFVFEGMEKVAPAMGPGPGGDQSDIAFTVRTTNEKEQQGGGHKQGGAQQHTSKSTDTMTKEKDTTQGWTEVQYHKRKERGGKELNSHRKDRDLRPEGPRE